MAQTHLDNDTSGVLYTDRRNFYMNPKQVAELWPSATPFTSLSRMLTTKRAPDPDFKMFEYRNKFYNAQMLSNGGFTMPAAGSTANVTYDGSFGVEPCVGLVLDVTCPDGTYNGQGVVDSVTSSTVFVIRTLVAGTNTTVDDNAVMHVVGHAAGEGSGSPDAWSDDLTTVWNSTQIFKTPVEITGTLLEAALRGYSSELARLRANKGKEHEMKKELSALVGRRVGGTAAPAHKTDANSKILRTSHGIIPLIEGYDSGANDHSISNSSFTYADWTTLMKSVYKYGNDDAVKYAVVGDGFLAWIGSFSSGSNITGTMQYDLPMKSTDFGFNIRNLTHQFGELRLIRSATMTNALDGKYSNSAVVLDPDNISHVTYRKSAYQTAIQGNDIDGIKDQYFSDEGIATTLPETHHFLTVE